MRAGTDPIAKNYRIFSCGTELNDIGFAYSMLYGRSYLDLNIILALTFLLKRYCACRIYIIYRDTCNWSYLKNGFEMCSSLSSRADQCQRFTVFP